MGAPDLMGTQGTYTLFAATSEPEKPLTHGDFCQLHQQRDTLVASVTGPEGKRVKLTYLSGELEVHGQSYPLSTDRYTPWIELKFGRVSGLVKFLKLDDSSFYMTAIQIAPDRPATPLSTPKTFSVALAKLLGPFATCGLAEDMGARDDRTLTLDAFLTQSYEIHEERERQFFHLLNRTGEGLCLAVFDGTDRIQHMTCDDHVLDELYKKMDTMVGRAAEQLKKEGDAQAYTLGLAGVSLNLKGREKLGMVEPAELPKLCREIAGKLSQLVDGEDRPIHTVHLSRECYQGPYTDAAPDLVIGYHPGYGVNKEAARGKVTQHIVAENQRPWVADHCFEPETVPGVLFSSVPLQENPTLSDLAPTILELFGVKPAPFQEGRSLIA
jgi:hypothetical protein